ncbi:DUF4913 domain-containing protein [Streptomyces sp. AV19]|uniref:DUF4913 domain-containing protein n=1 Tax=Streptomyces sp. AV19 TaxID=2793068 RepID=UPI0018FEAD37|nr:DUF4913 domain-containing protein [Streptomyces sp. AV19]MBH1934131.1 DUF4913 domain-containing protein [Streptomyces sp. AV19]MDG4537147.1 DUF4913 domain-containing protein [Streptomyces sp. AV19]
MDPFADEWADDNDATGAATTPEPQQAAPARAKRRRSARKQPPRELVFPTVADFVEGYFAPTIRRNLHGSATWCPRWWAHPEALLRMTAVWRAWEHLRHDPALGISNWLLQHADPHLRVLMDGDNGPLAACSPEGHSRYAYEPLPLEPADPAMWLAPALSAPPKS